MITVENVRNILQSTCPQENLECKKCLDKISNFDDSKISDIIDDSQTKGEVFYKLFAKYTASLPIPPNNKTKYYGAINEWIKKLQVLGINSSDFDPIEMTTEHRRDYVLKAIQGEGKSLEDLSITLQVSERVIRGYIKEIREKYNIEVKCISTNEKKRNGKRKIRKYVIPNTLHKIDMVLTMEELLVLFKVFRDILEIKDWPHRNRVGSLANRIWKQLDNDENNNYAQNRLKTLLSQAGHRTDVLLNLMQRANEKYEALNYGFDYEEYINGMEKEETWEYLDKRKDVEVMGDYIDDQGVKVSIDGCKVTLVRGTDEVLVSEAVTADKKKRKVKREPIIVKKSKFKNIIPK